MKHKATVTDVADPKQLGRIRVRMTGANAHADLTPWCWPCSMFAGPGYGFYCLPQIGDEVWVEQAASGEFVWTGFYWSARNAKPEAGTSAVRLFRTPAGHELSFDETGAVTITHSNGSAVRLEASGDIQVSGDGTIRVEGDDIVLNDDGGTVVTTECICAFTGNPHPQGSKNVKAKGPV